VDCPPDRGQPGNQGTTNWRESVVVKIRHGGGFRLRVRLGLDCRAWPDSLPAELTEWLCRCSTEGQHLTSALRPLQKVGPVLHHLGAGLQVEGVIVGGAHGVAWRVGELQLNMLVVVSLLVKDG